MLRGIRAAFFATFVVLLFLLNPGATPALAANPPSQIVEFRVGPQEAKIGDTVTLTVVLDQPIQVGYWVEISTSTVGLNACTTVGQQTCTWNFRKRLYGPQEFTARLIRWSNPIHTQGPKSIAQVPYATTLSVEPAETSVGEMFTYRASVNQPIADNSTWNIIQTNGGSGTIGCSKTSTECVGRIIRTDHLLYRFVSEIRDTNSGTLIVASPMEARPTPYEVTLDLSTTETRIGETFRYQAILNQPKGADVTFDVINTNGGSGSTSCSGQVTECSAQVTRSSSQIYRFVARVSDRNSGRVLAESVAIEVRPVPYEVTLEVNPTTVETGQTVSYTATLNQPLVGGQISIINRLNNGTWAICYSGLTCARQATPTTVGEHRLVAIVKANGFADATSKRL
jgi:hypothetical protein